ncbi:WD40 repeat domain-containing protein [Frankia sp. AiPa1]|uniref:WD40 repeat domain-containing protein n=1 Tax=Frankia sp. AiPa1 TaxID=573492 RepID=UPI00202B172B|nr:WD40 repeat domain-containing protein [Frankia sp. AiPa1]MCL9758800.1 WD40 repeat domain-containing protein [Frankia sp. AiPa1]
MTSTATGGSGPVRAMMGLGRGVVVTYTDAGTTAVWDLDTGEPTRVTLTGRVDVVRGAAVAPDASWVIVPGDLAELRRVDPVTGKVLATMTADDEIKTFAVDPTGTWIAASCGDGTLWRWDALSGRPLAPALPAHAGSAVACAVSPDGRWVATGGRDRLVRLWTASGRFECRRELTGHTDGVLGAHFAPDGRLLATAGADHTVRVWQVDDGRPAAILTGHTHTVRDARFSPDGTLLATAGGEGALWIWDTASWRPTTLMRFDGAARSCAWLPADLGLGVIVASSAGLFRYDYER